MPDNDVFISYSRADQEIARRIAEALTDAGREVGLTDHNMAFGSPNWRSTTEQAIDSAVSVIAIISSASSESERFQYETHYAIQQGKRIVPVVVGQADLPETLARFNAFYLSDPENFDRDIASLIATLGGIPDETLALRDLTASEQASELEPGAPPAPVPAPQPAEPEERARRRKREEPEKPKTATQTGAAKDQTHPPQFTAYYPEAVMPSSSYALMAFVHLESARAQVEEIALGYEAMMGGSQATTGVTSAIKVDVGSLITFVPMIAGITFDAAERVVAWQPPHQSATFLFSTPAHLPPTLTGHVLVYQGPLIIGEIPVKMQVIPTDQPVDALPGKSGEMQRLQPVFASYSHRDTPVMEYFRRSYERLGQKMLVDVYDLRAGEHWADRLLEMIGESAVFQLFWSRHSAQSRYCRQEWDCALRYLDERPRFIRPVWWQDPMPMPPPELADLHFQRVPLPVLTRMQIAMAKIRTVLK